MFLLFPTTTYITGETYNTETVSIYYSSNTPILSLLMVTSFLTCRSFNPDTFFPSNFNSDDSPNIKCWIVEALRRCVLYFLFYGRLVFKCLQYEAFFKFSRKANTEGGICYLFIHHTTPIWRICLSYSNIIFNFQPCAFSVIFRMLCFSLDIDNLPIQISSLTHYACLPINIISMLL